MVAVDVMVLKRRMQWKNCGKTTRLVVEKVVDVKVVGLVAMVVVFYFYWYYVYYYFVA